MDDLKYMMVSIVVIFFLGFITNYALMNCFLLGSILILIEAGVAYYFYKIMKEEYLKHNNDER